MSDITKLEPKLFWHHFNEICKIPHASKNEAALREYIIGVAKKCGLEYRVDAIGNLVVKKPAHNSKSRDAVIIQSHMDMICEAREGKKIDFDKEPITPVIDGDWVRADGTTLGADDGEGVAASLALMETKDITHGPLELVFVVEEEIGLNGARGLDASGLTGKRLINIDNTSFKELTIGSGGVTGVNIELPIRTVAAEAGLVGLKLEWSGLTGGHSGEDINRERGSAVKLLCRLLDHLLCKLPIRIADLTGGPRPNTISTIGIAVIGVPSADATQAETFIKEYVALLKKEYTVTEPNLELRFEKCDVKKVMDEASTRKVIDFINAAPNGVMTLGRRIALMVETSASTPLVSISGDVCKIVAVFRSTLASDVEARVRGVEALTRLAGGTCSRQEIAPLWEPDVHSKLLALATKNYKELTGEDPKIVSIHPALECGYFSQKIPGLDMISIGTDIIGEHTPTEKMGIASVGKLWKLVEKILGELAR